MRRILGAVLTCLLTVFAAIPVQADENVLDKTTETALKRNAAALSTVEMNYTFQRKPLIEEDEFLRVVVADWIKGDRCYLQPTQVELKHSADKSRIRTLFEGPKIKRSADGKTIELDGVDQWTVDVAFDGKNYYSGNFNSSKSFLVKDSIKDLAASAFRNHKSDKYFAADMIEYAGFYLPRSYAEFSSPELTSLPLQLLRGGAKVEESKDPHTKHVRLCLVNKAEVYVFELDPELGYAVIRQEKWLDNALIYKSKLSDFKQFSKAAIHFPQRADVDFYQWGKRITGTREKPVATETYTVTKMLDGPLGDDVFGKDIVAVYNKPGTYIIDGTLLTASDREGKRVSYYYPDDAKDLEKTIKAAMDKVEK